MGHAFALGLMMAALREREENEGLNMAAENVGMVHGCNI
jgi:hypothetical protein